jgi:orotidine-5'-phosphate decarboxylase
MMQAARERLEGRPKRPLLIGVTVLTSMAREDLAEIGLAGSPEQNVERLAALASDTGLDGVVCSPLEAEVLKKRLGEEFLLVTPGVRPASAAADDQRRVLTPAQAMAAGSDYLVVGRPITAAADPLQALSTMTREVG